jgi:hypothetical protein
MKAVQTRADIELKILSQSQDSQRIHVCIIIEPNQRVQKGKELYKGIQIRIRIRW